MPEVMSAVTALIRWSEVFFIIVYLNDEHDDKANDNCDNNENS